MRPRRKTERWRTYEEVARHLLNEFAHHFALGRVEGNQILPGESGTNWSIEAKAVRASGEAFLILECRRYTKSRLNQESMGALAYRIRDTRRGWRYRCIALGAPSWRRKKVADAENIFSAILAPASTTTDYMLAFLGRVFHGASFHETVQLTDTFDATVIRGRSDAVG